MARITSMELEGMKNGAFNMAKEECIAACREQRAALEAAGYATWLEYFTGDIFILRAEKRLMRVQRGNERVTWRKTQKYGEAICETHEKRENGEWIAYSATYTNDWEAAEGFAQRLIKQAGFSWAE